MPWFWTAHITGLRHLPAEINGLLTSYTVALDPDGIPSPETQLQHRPRHAPPPKHLHISFPGAVPPPDQEHGLLLFLRSCMQQVGHGFLHP